MHLFKTFKAVKYLLCAAIGMLTPIMANASGDPLVLYTFDEGKGSVVRDVSGNGAPLDLDIHNVENVRWLSGGGLTIDQPTVITGSVSPDKIVNAIKATNAVTIEAWVRPANKMQSGPARIATLSNGTKKRNFTLGQQNARYDVRFRSTDTNRNGMPSVSSADDTLDTQLTHVVYTRNSSGTAKIFINGVRKSRTTGGGDPSNWSDEFSFALANEISGDRPWLGDYFRFAIYNRALTKTEIVSNFNAGAGIKPMQDNPLALYIFDEGSGSIVHDRSNVGPPLDLNIKDTSRTSWLAGGGLSVDKATIISGTGTRKIIDAVKASNAISIEAWIKPAKTTQDGPARIVTLSANTGSRDFTLGQQQAAYDVRLRSTATDNNGLPSLTSPPGTLSTSLTHVVYTRDKNGTANLYINGSKQSKKTVLGDFSNWDTQHGFALANELTKDRPWLGELYLVAIYDRALDATDVDERYARSEYTNSSAGETSDTTTGSERETNDPNSSPDTNGGTEITGDTGTNPIEGDSDTSTPVTAPQVGSTTLSWSAPVSRSDGNALSMSEIVGYTLYYGPSAGNFPNIININDAYITSTTITGLPSGTYYFAVTAHDTDGQESAFSNIAAKVVN